MTKRPETTQRLLPRLIAWEVTRTCDMNCRHCRAAARNQHYDDELTTAQCLGLLEKIASFSKPIIILTGGEPMLRDDIYEIAAHGHRLGLRMVLATCGSLVDGESVKKMVQAGISCVSISLDGATADSHDAFRRVPGAFDTALSAVEALGSGNLPFQINTTITKHNLDELPLIMRLAEELGAVTFNPFLLVPTGRGAELAEQELTPQQYEQTLKWLCKAECDSGHTSHNGTAAGMGIRVTCAPHYQRIIRQEPQFNDRKDHSHISGGCMGGKSFAFISHTGKVQICGFLEIEAGDLRRNNWDFEDIWNSSRLFNRIRDVDSYKGKCGYCEYRRLCGGCRARAYTVAGDYLASEPFCLYQPTVIA